MAWHEVAVHALTARDNALRHAANTVQRTVYFAFLTWREQIEHKKQVVGRAEASRRTDASRTNRKML